MPTSFTIHESARVHKHLTGRIERAVHKGLVSAAYRIVQEIQTTIIPSEDPQPVDRGIFKAGWQVDPKKPVTIFNDTPQAPIIEFGARGENIKISAAMIQALQEWILRKGLVGPRARGRSARAQQEIEARNVAWAIAVSMKTKGIFNRNGQRGLRIGEKSKKLVPKFANEEVAREMKEMR